MQNAHTEFEFSAMTVLSRENIDSYGFEAQPAVLSGRVQHMTDPCKLAQSFPPHFDGAVLFLPGLAFTVPKELGTADRPLFAFRTHLFAFYLLRQLKQVLKRAKGHVHLVWPDEMALLSAPFGSAGVEMTQLLVSCGCVPQDPMFDMGRLEADALTPFVFGEVKESTEIPDWMEGVNIQSFTMDRDAIPVPLSVALLLHPEVGYTSIKDGRSSASPVAVAAAAATATGEADDRPSLMLVYPTSGWSSSATERGTGMASRSMVNDWMFTPSIQSGISVLSFTSPKTKGVSASASSLPMSNMGSWGTQPHETSSCVISTPALPKGALRSAISSGHTRWTWPFALFSTCFSCLSR
mmetsp:Transcript_29697/g.79381  ORF Transcript_29697/g.79381 Transcript_29697/m.79381 type:complete len:352 (+) Transcript_29697:1612-2667(+)